MAPLVNWRRITALTAVFAAVLVVGACGGASAQRTSGARLQVGEARFDALPARNLASGQCGMYVWAHGDHPVLMLIATDNPAQAVVRPGGRERTLTRSAFGGERIHGHFEEQTFSDGRMTLVVDVTLSQQGELRDGARIERGVVRLVDAEGWETIIPVGGLVACER